MEVNARVDNGNKVTRLANEVANHAANPENGDAEKGAATDKAEDEGDDAIAGSLDEASPRRFTRRSRSRRRRPRSPRSPRSPSSITDSDSDTPLAVKRRRRTARRALIETKEYYDTVEDRIRYLEDALKKVEKLAQNDTYVNGQTSSAGLVNLTRIPPSPRRRSRSPVFPPEDELSRTVPELKWLNWAEWVSTTRRPEPPEKVAAIEGVSGFVSIESSGDMSLR